MVERIIKMSDFHIPFHDNKTIDVAIKFIKYIRPTILIIDETLDFYSISKFNKDPRRKLRLQKDIDTNYNILCKLKKSLKGVKIHMVASNHDKRLRKYLNSKAEELSQLRCLKFEELLGLNKLDISYSKVFMFRGVLFKHGDIVRVDSAYTAKAEMNKEGTSGASGHTHRLGVYFRTLRGGSYVWIEGGCVCMLTACGEYIEGTANWQQGLCMYTFLSGKKRFHPEAIPIIDHEILWGGRVWR